jgi:hypothetical protein
LQHVFVPQVWVINPFECPKPAFFPLLFILPLIFPLGTHLKTGSPYLVSVGFTFLFFHLRVSSWYLFRFVAACNYAISMMSKDAAMSWGVVFAILKEPNFISSGVMASSPYRSLNGDNFVALESAKLYD